LLEERPVAREAAASWAQVSSRRSASTRITELKRELKAVV
jgi:hypothetical protein